MMENAWALETQVPIAATQTVPQLTGAPKLQSGSSEPASGGGLGRGL